MSPRERTQAEVDRDERLRQSCRVEISDFLKRIPIFLKSIEASLAKKDLGFAKLEFAALHGIIRDPGVEKVFAENATDSDYIEWFRRYEEIKKLLEDK
jgi:hypothetical protein